MAPHENEHEHPKREVRKDAWGNEFREFKLMDLQAKKTCSKECNDHVTMTYSVEMEVTAVSGMEALLMLAQGEQPPTEKKWVPVTRVLSSYN